MEIKTISSSAEIGCLNCIWFHLIREEGIPPTDGICYLNFPETNTYTEIWDRCPKGVFIVKHKYYGYSSSSTKGVIVREKEGILIKDEDPIEQYPCDSEGGPIGWCDK